ncbi:MAG: type 1 glutamine amidotransferase [Ignavibacterium sp.]|nr:type 1 glutamine amidotransferase [Ignavibacterium sp.]
MKPKLTGKKILMFVDDIYEDLELLYPKIRMIEEGAQVIIAGSFKMKVYSGKHGYPCKSDASFDEIHSNEFDALIIPGGFAPDKLRREKKVLDITREIFNSGKLVAHICHAGWIPISAGIMKGYKCTSTPGIKDDLMNAGAEWFNEPVVIDRNMISSRNPGDLPEFCRAIIKMLSQK